MDQFDKNIIGYEATKQRLRQLCDILRNKHYYEERGASLPHGLLLHSAPGLGKTLMAKTLMDASGRYSRILRKENEEEAFLKSLRDVFNDAKEHSPSILLLEDINLYADSPSPYGSQWACLQSCIDNVKDDDVFVIATTNATQCIPASLLRPGRFDLTITLEPPQGEVAEQIAAHYLKGRPLDDDVVISDIVRAMGSSASCAMLESVMNLRHPSGNTAESFCKRKLSRRKRKLSRRIKRTAAESFSLLAAKIYISSEPGWKKTSRASAMASRNRSSSIQEQAS